ncbi:MAG: type I methionyl aminopeptidase [Acidobacteriia bacterium]|nr:type I methionyl aminopeptidase [Terriglobia bacterium]
MIVCKSQSEIEKMRRASMIVHDILEDLRQAVKPGMSTSELDAIAERKTRESGARPAFKGYRGYPKSLCTSINQEVVHGIPSERRVLKEGDIIGLDYGVIVEGYFGDAAITVPVGTVNGSLKKLLQVTEESLELGIAQVRPGHRISDIGSAVQQHAEASGFSVVREFCGHGIGTALHEDPQIPNYGTPGHGPILKEGMVLALEPMINEGTFQVKILEDQWTAVTVDGRNSAHFEHTVAVTHNGPWVLSRP